MPSTQGAGVLDGAGAGGAGVLGAGVLGAGALGAGVGDSGVGAGVELPAGLAVGLAGEGMTRLGFCLSGSTKGPFWPQASSPAVKQTITHQRAAFILSSIPAGFRGLPGTSRVAFRSH
jgi:hypothetical protein